MARLATTSSRPARTALLIAGVAIAATAALLARGAGVAPDGAPAAIAVAASPNDPRWREGDERAYLLTVDSNVDLDGATSGTPVVCALHALLCLRVADVDAQAAEVAFQLRDVTYRVGDGVDEARQRALGVPFVAHFDGGMPVRFRFPAGLEREVQDQLAEVVRTFQATTPDRAETSWTALEQHQSGRYRAVYATAPDGSWQKRKAAYVRGADVVRDGAVHGQATVRVLASSGSLTPAREWSWWDRAEIEDELELSNDGQVVARVATRSVLTAADAAFDPNAAIATIQRTERLLDQPVPAVVSDPAVIELPEPKPATAADRARFQELLDGFVAGQGRELAFVHRLAAMLREFPELAAELPPMLKDPGLLGTVAAGLAHALELAGNRQCQEALGTICSEPDFPESNRLRAIVALSGVAAPTDHTVELLTWLSGDASTGTDAATRDRGATALLALGRLGNTLQTAGSERYAAVAADLQRVAHAGADANLRATALKAIANTRDADLAPTAMRALDADAAPVRAAAAETIAVMDQRSGFERLTERLGTEKDGRVRAAIAAGMRQMSHHDEAAFTTCANLVTAERDPAARGEMARYLVDNLHRYPQGREVLERLVRTETDRETLSYVAGRLFRERR